MALTKTNSPWGVLTGTPVPSSLLDHLTIAEGVGWLHPEGIAETYNCIDVDNEIPWPCPAPDPGIPALPEPVAVPATATGGALAAGSYAVTVTALDANGETTGTAAPIELTGDGDESIDISWGSVAGATGYNIYVALPGGELGLVGTATEGPFTYEGTPAPAAPPPTENTTGVDPEPLPEKVFSSPSFLDGFTFVTQGGITCKPFDFTLEKGEKALREAFRLRESKGVERALVTKQFTTANGTEDLTPTGGAVDPGLALAILEGYAGSVYSGQPMIHVSRTVGSLLTQPQAVTINNGLAHTRLGAKVAIGAGYEYPNVGPDGSQAADGEQWIYASGEVLLARGDLLVTQGIDPVNNDLAVMAERAYVGGVDCFTAAIRVKVSA